MNNIYVGQIGENIAVRFLKEHGFYIQKRNVREKFGELDIVAEKNEKFYFYEVKAVCGSFYRPEENVHSRKVKRIRKMIQMFVGNREAEFVFSVIAINLDLVNRKYRIRVIENVIL